MYILFVGAKTCLTMKTIKIQINLIEKIKKINYVDFELFTREIQVKLILN